MLTKRIDNIKHLSFNRFIISLFFLSIINLIYLLMPEELYAWGPGLHIKVGLDIIDNIQIIAPAIAEMISKNHYYYLYGLISPDILVDKKFSSEMDHCHNWEVGRALFTSSKSDSEKAFAYGYLSHLAGDVVAHNFFVPNQIIANFGARTLRHIYWELRFDGLLSNDIWDIFKEIPKDVRGECNDLMEKILTTSLFSFSTNKNIFTGIMHINRISHWQEMIRTVSNRSQWVLMEKDIKNYYNITLQSVSELLSKNELAQCMKSDPNGKNSLSIAKKIRKDLRVLYNQGKLSDGDCVRIINELRPRFMKKMSTTDQALHTIKFKSNKKN